MVKILLDTLGIDKGFEEVVLAAVNSVKVNKNVELTLVGSEEDILNELYEQIIYVKNNFKNGDAMLKPPKSKRGNKHGINRWNPF